MAQKTLEGISSRPSLDSISLVTDLDIVNNLGICCGKNETENLSIVKSLFENNGSVTEPWVRDEEVFTESDYVSEVEEDERSENLRLKKLCEELVEEVFDDDPWHPSSVFFQGKRVYKSSAKSRKGKTCKVKFGNNIKKMHT